MQSRGHRGRRIVSLCGALAVGVLTASATLAHAEPAAPTAVQVPVRAAAAVPVPPELDPGFYRPPADLVAAAAPGQILAARLVNAANFGLIPLNVDAWQVSFRSNDSRDEAIPAVATVLKPRGSAPDKMLSVQIAVDSLAAYCSPSYAVQQWSAGAALGQIVAPLEFILAQGALQQGWAVVIPDHQGPKEAYAAGPLAGRITLDGIRAARAFEPLRVAPDARIGLYGYSGGAIATGHAAELKRSYAPELNIVGAAAGGVPADLGPVLVNGNRGLWSGMILSAVIGLAREYPDFAALLDRRLDPLGKALATVKGGLCVQWNTALAPFLDITGFLRAGGDPFDDPAVRRVLEQTRMGKAVPDLPMYIWQGNPDELIPVGPVDTLVDTYCQDPAASVRYTREHFAEHIATEVSGVGPAMLWLRDRLDGVPAQQGCTTADVGWLALDPEGTRALAENFGETFASFFGKPIGTDG
ncbi:lipase family protein [Nocardia jiangsuensis]|uniref:Lipase family protein n=1 Tax=Nocardia jiangsuensis TaxID=1691563 RepID=A0ABV8DZZ7_9NOCA